MMRTQIDPRGMQGGRPHNRMSQFDDRGGRYEEMFNYENPQQQAPPPQQQTSVPDLGTLLQQVSQQTGGFGGPNFQLPGISGLSAGGGTQVGPNGIEIQAPDQSNLYNSYMNTVSALGTGQQNLVGSVIGDMLGLTGQLGTANINAGAQRDVAGINANSNEAIALTQAKSASEVAGIQAQSAENIEAMRQAGLISELEAQERIAGLNNASAQRIAEIQAEASVRPAELQYQQFTDSMEQMGPFFEAMLRQFGGGGIAGSSDTAYQLDPQALVNNAQAQNAMGAAAANRAGAAGGGAAANDAAARAIAQQEAAANAQAAYNIPLQVNQQNFENRLAQQQGNTAMTQGLAALLNSILS